MADVVASSSGSSWNNEPLMSHTVTAVQLNYPATTNRDVQFDDPEEKQSVLFGCLEASHFVWKPVLIDSSLQWHREMPAVLILC